MTKHPNANEMKKAFYEKDATYDGIFFTGVKTTGIFCRPSCTAKKPLPENIEFFPTVKTAHFAGYRPCKRCDPLNIDGTPPGWIQKLLTEVDSDPATRIRDGGLRERHLEPARVRRYFLKNYGMTFQAYCRGKRLGKAFEKIRKGENLDVVALDHGYESNSGFREAFARVFRQSPGKSRGKDCVTMAWIESPLGPLVAGATDKGICLLEFSDRRMLEAQFRTVQKYFKDAIVPGTHKYVTQLKKELTEYFKGTRKNFDVPLDFPGSEFQKNVWNHLQKIPYGKTWSYEDLAKSIQNPKANRAVGTANGMNRIAILIPCHRVVNKNGELGGYGGGVWRKQFLLDLETGVNRLPISDKWSAALRRAAFSPS